MFKSFATLAAGLLFLVMSAGLRPASALTITGAQDCDSNAVIRCGVANSKDLATDFQNISVSHIYSFFGISQADINNFDSQTVAGSVTRHGAVVVNGKIVATNAMTAGRQNIAGSTKETMGSTTFYTRPPSVSFQQSSLPAYVVMHNGQFAYAVIASCGNPVKATPVKPPKVKVVPPPVMTKTPPPPTQTQTQTVTVTTPASESEETALPNTGPGNVLGVGGVVAVASGLGHFFYSRRKTI